MKGKPKNKGIRQLNEREILFIAEYCNNGFNGSQAAIIAGYSKKGAGTQAGRMLKNAEIRNGIKAYLDEILGQYKDTLEFEIIKTYKIRAFYNTSDILTEDGALKVERLEDLGDNVRVIDGIETRPTKSGDTYTVIKLANREKALEQLTLYMGLIKQADVNFINNITIGTPPKPEDAKFE